MHIDPAPRPVPLDLDPAAIRRQADETERDAEQRAGAILAEAREKAAALRSAADRIEDARELMRRAAGMMGPRGVPAESLRLPSDTDTTTIDPMDTSGIATAGPQPSGPKFKSKHPLARRAQELKRSMPAVAKELTDALRLTLNEPITRQRVRSWYTTNEGDKRPIPEAAVRYLERAPWGIPRRAWRNGIQG